MSTSLLIVLALAMLIYMQTYSKTFWIMAWPGTAMHEILHWIVGWATLARPTSISLFPKIDGDRAILGSVWFENIGWWNAVPVALAPLLGIPLCIMFVGAMPPIDLSTTGAFTAWVAASVLSQSFPSREDWQVAFSQPVGIAMYAALGYWMIN
jgi:hypothetical protein